MGFFKNDGGNYYTQRQQQHAAATRSHPTAYFLSEYTEHRKTKTHRQTVDIMVKPYKGQRKTIAKELEHTGALWKQKQKVDTSGRT